MALCGHTGKEGELTCNQACKELGYDRGDCSIEGDCLMLGYPSCYGGLCIFGTTLETGLNRTCEEPQVCCCSYEEPCEASSSLCTYSGCVSSFTVYLPVVAKTLECQTETDCDDGNPCTFDMCVEGQCKTDPSIGQDRIICSGGYCLGGACH